MLALLALANRADLPAPVDAEDLAELARWPWFEMGGYVVRKQRTASGGSTLIYLHRFLMQARPFEVVDHINNNRLDNRRVNLRLCTQSENLANRPAPMPHGYRGVYPEGSKWRAQIKANGKNKRLGTFPTPEAAALAYDRAARAAFGRFARLNFPHIAQEEQLALPGLDDPFGSVPTPATARVDFYEIAQERRWRAARALAPTIADGLVDNVGIPF